MTVTVNPMMADPISQRRALRRQSGFTLFELIVVIILVAWLAGSFFTRFLLYQEAAEKVTMEQTAGAVRSALNIQMAGLITRGKSDDISKLATMNPIVFLASKPSNYVGEFYAPRIEEIPTGSWYFDMKYKQLVYLVARDTHFLGEDSNSKWVRFQVKLTENTLLSTTVNGVEKKDIGGVNLEVVTPYKWVVN